MANDHLNDTTEIWKTIPSFPVYAASTLGRIQRISTGHIKRTWISGVGYLQISVSMFCKTIIINVHRLVAEAFLGPCPDCYQVNHKDGIKTNNHIENLEYVTRSENQKHARRIKLNKEIGETHHSARLTEQQVREIRIALNRAPRPTHQSLADQYGVSRRTIGGIHSGKGWKHIT